MILRHAARMMIGRQIIPNVQKVRRSPQFVARYTSHLKTYSTGSENVQNEDLALKIDESAVKRLKVILDADEFLRVFVESGGCSGYQYKFEVDKDIEEDEDISFVRDGVKVVSDEMSLKILNGSTLEFHEDMLRAGFRIVDIPQAEKGCSCGVSFDVKL